jgi:hypothetical protein
MLYTDQIAIVASDTRFLGEDEYYTRGVARTRLLSPADKAKVLLEELKREGRVIISGALGRDVRPIRRELRKLIPVDKVISTYEGQFGYVLRLKDKKEGDVYEE